MFRTVPSWSFSQAVSKTVWHIPLLWVQGWTTDDGQRNCPKHVEFYSKNKFEKLVHLVGFIIRIYHDARSAERQIWNNLLRIPGNNQYIHTSHSFSLRIIHPSYIPSQYDAITPHNI